jgi:LacI family transcriptional regulator
MKDIAQLLNVSIVTVSKVLNGDKTISERTRKKVLDCADQVGYKTNLATKSLVSGSSRRPCRGNVAKGLST